VSSDNVQRTSWGRPRRAAAAYAASLLVTGVAWDLAGSFRVLPAWWPTVSYVCIAAGAAAALGAILIHILTTPRAHRTPQLTLLQLVAIGVVLAASVLRGDAEIPTDPPLIYAQLVGGLGYLVAHMRAERRPRETGNAVPRP
jgi:hypothetical protein